LIFSVDDSLFSPLLKRIFDKALRVGWLDGEQNAPEESLLWKFPLGQLVREVVLEDWVL
jgi:hypothetical protein